MIDKMEDDAADVVDNKKIGLALSLPRKEGRQCRRPSRALPLVRVDVDPICWSTRILVKHQRLDVRKKQ